MKSNESSLPRPVHLAILAGVALALSGCGNPSRPDPATAAQDQERERLKSENQELAQVRSENEEVQRLKKENQSLPKLRSQYQETARLKKENEQLHQQIAKAAPPGSTNAAAIAAMTAAATATGAAGQAQTNSPAQESPDALALNDGDDVMINPKDFKALVPDIDWEKLGRKEPLGVRAIFERDGNQLTNAAQLRDYGITNFTIRRAPPTPAPANTPAQETR